MEAIQQKYLRGPLFDYFFILFIPLLGISVAYYAVANPVDFYYILTVNLWLFGYHHVIATFTRIAGSVSDAREYRFLVFYLPLIVLGIVIVLAMIGSAWLIASVYLYWQWWHYLRQSEGIAKSIKFKVGSRELGPEWFTRGVFYLVPIATFVIALARQPATFLLMRIYTPPIPMTLATMLGYLTLGLWVVWLLMQMIGLQKKKLRFNHFSYLVSHHAVYLVAYVLIADISIGWLAINIWHNLQYIVFVWHFNVNTYREGFDKTRPIISWLSQPHRAIIYFSACMIMTLLVYKLVGLGASSVAAHTVLPVTIIAYMSLNFHHYIVDTVIWKIRNPKIRKAIGIKEIPT